MNLYEFWYEKLLWPAVCDDGLGQRVHPHGQEPDEDDEQEEGGVVLRVLGPDDDGVEADEGLDDGEDDEEGGEDLHVGALGLEVEQPEEDGAAEEAAADAVEEEHDGERNHREAEPVQGNLKPFFKNDKNLKSQIGTIS